MSKGTHNRNVRVADDLWEAARTAAERNDTTVSEIIREALARYVEQNQKH